MEKELTLTETLTEANYVDPKEMLRRFKEYKEKHPDYLNSKECKKLRMKQFIIGNKEIDDCEVEP